MSKINNRSLNENLEAGDLKRLINSKLHIDEYKSKMGGDADVCVVSFKVGGKEPSTDLVSFIEKGYDWVLDADVSSGEKEGGDYLVFVEAARTQKLPEQIYQLIDDVTNLTEQDIAEWELYNSKAKRYIPLTKENLARITPLTPEKYKLAFPADVKADEEQEKQDKMDKLKMQAGIDVTTKAPVNAHTDSIRVAAGLK